MIARDAHEPPAQTHDQLLAALKERVKELTCLYGITQVAQRPDATLEEVLQGIAELLPPGWQFPETTCARIVLDGREHATRGFASGCARQQAAVVIGGQLRGYVEVVYTREEPTADEGPFLQEERSLIEAIATQVALIVERRETAQERARLEEQLRHADRLATIGQLAAGVAHELNEPLSNILGFAQLAAKHPDLASQLASDLEKIVTAALHARDVVKKLMLFARQTPPLKARTNLNDVVEQALAFLEARCSRQGVEVCRSLSHDLPAITADRSQILQVLVNLVVNALHAMPAGGRLTIATAAGQGGVQLAVADTGVGMSEEVRSKVFIPFFTTKDVDQGTGLGLSVVHGIVTSHSGSIRVESEEGSGSLFEITLPTNGTPVEERGDRVQKP